MSKSTNYAETDTLLMQCFFLNLDIETIDLFGIDRCMFESNFPVDKGSCSYGVLWNTFKKISDNFSNGEKNKLFYQNAKETYNIRI